MRQYRFSHAERADDPIALLCLVLAVARSACYAWARRGATPRRALQACAAPASAWQAWSAATGGGGPARPSRNRRTPPRRIRWRDFRAAASDRLGLGDSMSVATREGWLDLAVLLDAHSRRVVGWALADHLSAAQPRPLPGEPCHRSVRPRRP